MGTFDKIIREAQQRPYDPSKTEDEETAYKNAPYVRNPEYAPFSVMKPQGHNTSKGGRTESNPKLPNRVNTTPSDAGTARANEQARDTIESDWEYVDENGNAWRPPRDPNAPKRPPDGLYQSLMNLLLGSY